MRHAIFAACRGQTATRRTIKAGDPGSFSPAELTVRNGLVEQRRGGHHGKALSFGANRQQQERHHGEPFEVRPPLLRQDSIGLRYLHEIRVSEAAAARLTGDQYHLFWNKEHRIKRRIRTK